VFDVGIAEQHAVTAAAGMAMGGLRPIVAIYSTFLTRAIDQINLDVGLHRLPVVFCVDRAGVTGDDGPSHHGVLDLALLQQVPGITILAPSSAEDLRAMLEYAVTLDGPVAIRYPKGLAPAALDGRAGTGCRARQLRRGRDVCILAVGKTVAAAEEAARALDEDGISCSLWDLRAVKPLDRSMLDDAATHPLVVTVEDGVRHGGAGSAVAAALAAYTDVPCLIRPTVRMLGVPDAYIPQGHPDHILATLGLDGPGIARAVLAEMPGPVVAMRR
jgi:1-deoxy-D-xylulose-5-phosphate synthase